MMWRHLTRGFFQQGIKRTYCIEKPDSCVKDSKAHHCCIKQLLPCAFQKVNLSKVRDGSQDGKENEEETSGNISHHSFLEAFGWSGALVFGWVISKQIWLRHIWTQDQEQKNKRIVSDHTFIPFLSHIVKTQPPAAYVLPQLQSPSRGRPKSDKDLEDEFEIAAKELEEVHNKAIGQALNRRGIACLSKSTASEAIKYFKRASEFKYPPASFNMGQCCELGIGTNQDFSKAAEWYKIASEQGHPTAMYNLGVFYAHGWGGLTADIDTARQFFSKAAQLGQPNAKVALDRESKLNSSVINKTNDSRIAHINIKDHETKTSDLHFFVNNVRIDLGDNIFQKGFTPDNNWDFPLNNTELLTI